MILRPIAALVAAVMLAGCQSVDVKPAQPTLHIPTQWRTVSGPASPTEQLWWRNFHDNHLNRYVDQALQHNSDVLIARERINEYQARVYAADGSLFPSPRRGRNRDARPFTIRGDRAAGLRYIVQREPDGEL